MFGLLVVVALGSLILLTDGWSMHSDFKSYGVADCLPGSAQGSYCSQALDAFRHDQNQVSQFATLFLALPLIYGAFLGAPLLAREYESGTYRFAFTQGAGRTRWLVTKILVLSAFTIVSAFAFTCAVMWWFSPLVPLSGRLGQGNIYEIYGAVFVARALLALALGIFAGALLRKVVPAIAATLAGWLAVVIPSITTLRTLLGSPIKSSTNAPPANAWILSNRLAGPDGHILSRTEYTDLMQRATNAGHQGDLAQYLAGNGYRHMASYYPADRFWPFQTIEAGALAMMSIALLVAAVWLVRRRAA